jgi:hypothetical protein
MAKGKTLWEMLVERFTWTPTELTVYNPLKAKVGSAATINTIEWRDFNFFITEIREMKRSIGGREFFTVDYTLLARPIGADDVMVRLRLNPVDDPDRAAGLSHDVLLLRLYDQIAYDKGFHDVVTDTTGKFEVRQDGVVVEEYWRINDVKTSYQAKVAIVKDLNRDKKVTSDEIERRPLEYWDYWRETKDEGGQPLRQFLFVEMDQKDGWFQIWRGEPIDPNKVTVI